MSFETTELAIQLEPKGQQKTSRERAAFAGSLHSWQRGPSATRFAGISQSRGGGAAWAEGKKQARLLTNEATALGRDGRALLHWHWMAICGRGRSCRVLHWAAVEPGLPNLLNWLDRVTGNPFPRIPGHLSHIGAFTQCEMPWTFLTHFAEARREGVVSCIKKPTSGCSMLPQKVTAPNHRAGLRLSTPGSKTTTRGESPC